MGKILEWIFIAITLAILLILIFCVALVVMGYLCRFIFFPLLNSLGL